MNDRSANKSAARVVGAIAGFVGVFAPSAAHAVECADLPSPVYGLGGSATKPLLAKVGAALAAASPAQTVVYQSPGACVGVNGIIGGTGLTGTASYWDASGKEQTCNVPEGQAIDFANTGNSATSCPGVSALPTDIGDFEGPVTAVTFIAPKASSQVSISSEAAYFVFGFGQQGQAAPWTDEAQIFRRDASSFVQLFVGLASGVPPEKFKGIDTKSNGGTITAVAQSTKPEAAIGIVSGEVADANRASVKILSYQHTGQRCGFWPDSTATSFDKRSLRSGQYWLWTPVHFFARVDAQKKITSPGADKLIGYFTRRIAAPAGVDFSKLEIDSGNVPKCAMNVWRNGDLGPLERYVPDEPCGCFFEKTATGQTSCTACTTDTTCPNSAPKCRSGFCEAK